MKYLYKTLGAAVLRAVPKALVSAELEKTKAALEKDVLGERFDDDVAFVELPAHGRLKDLLERVLA